MTCSEELFRRHFTTQAILSFGKGRFDSLQLLCVGTFQQLDPSYLMVTEQSPKCAWFLRAQDELSDGTKSVAPVTPSL